MTEELKQWIEQGSLTFPNDITTISEKYGYERGYYGGATAIYEKLNEWIPVEKFPEYGSQVAFWIPKYRTLKYGIFSKDSFEKDVFVSFDGGHFPLSEVSKYKFLPEPPKTDKV